MATAAQARHWLSQHGTLNSQPSTDWCGSIELPTSVEQFYREVGPIDLTLEAYGNAIFLPKFSSLWDFQAGYRWNGLTGEAIADWQDDWLVIADQGGDPFILSRSSGEVLFAEHGTGSWDAELLFADLNTMAVCLAMLASIVLEAGEDFTDTNGSIQPQAMAMARSRLRTVLAPAAIESVLFAFGWHSYG